MKCANRMTPAKCARFLIAAVLLGSLTIGADPIITWDWTPASTYENGLPIGADDPQTWTLHCNTTPDEQGQPYEIQIALDDANAPPSSEDMAPVHGGTMGNYWCAATQFSSKYLAESRFSNEKVFIVTAQTTGFVPNPPVLL